MRHAYDIRRDTTVEARYAREAMEARTLERLLNIYERNAARSGPLGDIREADVIRQVIMITSQAPRLSGAEETILHRKPDPTGPAGDSRLRVFVARTPAGNLAGAHSNRPVASNPGSDLAGGWPLPSMGRSDSPGGS